MHHVVSIKRCSLAVALAMAVLLSPAVGFAQLGGGLPIPTPLPLPIPTPTATSSVLGSASAVSSTVLGFTTVLGSTGTLSGVNDARDASMTAGSLPSILTGETLSAATIGWPNQVYSTASLTNLSMAVAGIGITADSVTAEASQIAGSAGTGSSSFSNLAIAGVPINVTGAPNQVVAIPGGIVTINEQTISPTGAAVVNALHVAVAGVANLVVASATAGIS